MLKINLNESVRIRFIKSLHGKLFYAGADVQQDEQGQYVDTQLYRFMEELGANIRVGTNLHHIFDYNIEFTFQNEVKLEKLKIQLAQRKAEEEEKNRAKEGKVGLTAKQRNALRDTFEKYATELMEIYSKMSIASHESVYKTLAMTRIESVESFVKYLLEEKPE